MTQHRPDSTAPTGLARLAVLVALAAVSAVLYAGCQDNQNTANQTPPAANAPATNSATANAATTQPPSSSATPEKPTGEKKEWKTEEEAQAYIKKVISEEKDKFEKKEKRIGHDEPIIITDGSLHIKSSLLSLAADFDLDGSGKKLTRKKTGSVVLVYIVNHPTPTTTQQTTYQFSGNAHSEVSVDYQDAAGHPAEDFLTVTTRDGGEKMVIKSKQVPFTDAGWDRSDAHDWVFEKRRRGGHKKVKENDDVFVSVPPSEFPEVTGNSYVEYHIIVPDTP
ncbi:MAG: hypothetical protein ACJ741_14600 [Pyrinomonadaceae bacterium]